MSEERINWWAGAQLLLRSGKRGIRATEIYRGTFLDAMDAALARPEIERPRLFIRCEGDDKVLFWPSIALLAARPDFPTMI